jgi:hypothetical protein
MKMKKLASRDDEFCSDPSRRRALTSQLAGTQQRVRAGHAAQCRFDVDAQLTHDVHGGPLAASIRHS